MPNNEFNDQEYQWYELDEQGNPAEALDSKTAFPGWLKWTLFVIVLVLVLVVAVFLLRSMSEGSADGQQTERITQIQAREQECEQARDKEDCLLRIHTGLARTSGDSLYCKDLTGDAYNSCILEVAMTVPDRDICQQIENSEKQASCEDTVWTLLTMENRTLSDCDTYNDAQRQNNCRESLKVSAIIGGDCDFPGITPEECSAGLIIQRAEENGDASECPQIPDMDWQHMCFYLSRE